MGDKDTLKLKKMYGIDEAATKALAQALAKRESTREKDVEELHRHLETSNKPSARVMLLLNKLRAGEPLPPPETRVAPGSYLDKKRKKEEEEKKKKDRSRSREQRHRSPERSDRGRARGSGDRDDRGGRDR